MNKLRAMGSGRQMGVQAAVQTLEAPNHAEEKRQVLEAINNLGLKVTTGSVAEKTGLPVLKVTGLLNRIAYETQGQLVVDTAGSVTYKFAPSFEQQYLLNSSRNFFRWLFRIVFNATAMAIKVFSLALFFLIRISFGILLVASVVLVVVLAVAAIVSVVARVLGSGGDGDGPDFGGDGGDIVGEIGKGVDFDWLAGLRYWTFDWLWDWWFWGRYFWWDPWDPWYRSRYDYYGWDSGRDFYDSPARKEPEIRIVDEAEDGRTRDTENKTNFLDNCFAVLFGTGDPNVRFEGERWKIVARAIKAKSGVVLAEDLAPYVETTDRNEDWMLPILIRFNGCPDVTESGKLVYTFPSFVPEATVKTSGEHKTVDAESSQLNDIYARFLNRQKAQAQANANAHSLPPFIQENTWSLTGLPIPQVVLVLGFAIVASGGALGLLMWAPGFSYVQMLRPALLGIAAYAGLFILLPAMRWPFVASMNARIESRNDAHVAAAQALAHPSEELAKHQQEADNIRRNTIAGETSVAYTTEEDLLEQQFR